MDETPAPATQGSSAGEPQGKPPNGLQCPEPLREKVKKRSAAFKAIRFSLEIKVLNLRWILDGHLDQLLKSRAANRSTTVPQDMEAFGKLVESLDKQMEEIHKEFSKLQELVQADL